MKKDRYAATLKRLNEKFNSEGWSISDPGWTIYDAKLKRDLLCFKLTQHPHSMALLVIELNQGEQQQNQDFYENKIQEIKRNNKCSLGYIFLMTFDSDDQISFELTTDNL